MANTPVESARSLRSSIQRVERDASRLRLLESVCAVIALERDPRAALRGAIGPALRFVVADGGAVLQSEAGGLVVQATQGPMLPVKARLSTPALLTICRKGSLVIKEDSASPFRVRSSAAAALEILLPLRIRGETAGLLVLSSAARVVRPDAADCATLEAVGAVLGLTLDNLRSARAVQTKLPDAAGILAQLTAREQQVFALLPRGFSNAELADQLGIAPGTAKVHIERILRKLGLRDRTQAAVRATEWGVGV